MKRTLSMPVLVFAWLAAAGGGVVAQGGGAPSPSLQVVPLWPQPLPNHWVLGSVTGVTVDARDRIWVTHRGADSLEGEREGHDGESADLQRLLRRGAVRAAVRLGRQAPVEFRRPGPGLPVAAVAWQPRGRRQGQRLDPAAGLEPAPPPSGRGRSGVDTTAAGVAAAQGPPAGAPQRRRRDLPTRTCSSSRRTGNSCCRSATPGKMDGPDSQTTLNRPAAVAVDAAANEVYVADSGNHRIVVFDSETGAYKRHWGAYGEKPTAAGGGPYDPERAARAAVPRRHLHRHRQGRHGVCLRPDQQPDPGRFRRTASSSRKGSSRRTRAARPSPASSASCRRTGRCGISPSRTMRGSSTSLSRTDMTRRC